MQKLLTLEVFGKHSDINLMVCACDTASLLDTNIVLIELNLYHDIAQGFKGKVAMYLLHHHHNNQVLFSLTHKVQTYKEEWFLK
jgi:hypothetical protein